MEKGENLIELERRLDILHWLKDVVNGNVRVINDYLYLESGERCREFLLPFFEKGFVLFRIKQEKSNEGGIAFAANYGMHQRVFQELAGINEMYGLNFLAVMIGKNIQGWDRDDELCLMLTGEASSENLEKIDLQEIAKEIALVHRITKYIIKNPMDFNLQECSYNPESKETYVETHSYSGIKSLEESVRRLFSVKMPVFIKGSRINAIISNYRALENHGFIFYKPLDKEKDG